LRGLRTFPLRFRAAEASAREIIKRLPTLAQVSNIRYPGFGAIISFEIGAPIADIEKVLDATSLISNATSLGGVETTWERRRRWPSESESISENLVRLSVGCEHIEDLWSDISRAIATLKG
jgi:cystathionine gamma-synthase